MEKKNPRSKNKMAQEETQATENNKRKENFN